MFFFGSSVREPSSAWYSVMNTRFHTSRKRPQSGSRFGLHVPARQNSHVAARGPRSTKISLFGPHGPTSPLNQ